ncbi:MAG: DUF72 domain-containing protein [Spirochaetales bacterium]|nr:DUF72 domain-containing protein [Spirochaetales bacterium]
MKEIYIGTSGYSYKDWIGPVYPPGTNQKDFLSYYSEEFSIVELNFSYYRQPEAGMLEQMIKKSRDGFLFSIKAHKALTHEIDEHLEEQIGLYKKGIDPLMDHGRLGAVLFQFPYSFHYTDENRRSLDTITKAFDGFPTVIEFRSDEWVRESVVETLASRNVGFVNVDEPDLPRLIKPGDIVTSDIGYIRFHGRNKANWWQGTNTSRYDYLYRESELAEWIVRIEKIIETAKIILIAFNNHYKGQAVQNARMLKEMLGEKGGMKVL